MHLGGGLGRSKMILDSKNIFVPKTYDVQKYAQILRKNVQNPLKMFSTREKKSKIGFSKKVSQKLKIYVLIYPGVLLYAPETTH